MNTDPICKIYRLSKELNLYHVVFRTQYLMNMHFWRDSPVLSGKSLTLIDFMEEYVENEKSECFSYTSEYEGLVFNNEIFKSNYTTIIDENKYDLRVKKINEILFSESENYYCIITFNDYFDDNFYHELSHFLYSSNKKYRITMKKNIKSIDEKIFKKLKKVIRKSGYTSGINNELHAYLATGFMFKDCIQEIYIPRSTIEDLELKFKETFSFYKEKLKINKEHMIDL